MRTILFRTGWLLLIVLPIAYIVQIVWVQDLPAVEPWKWMVIAGAVILVYFARNDDDVLKHHVV